MNDSNQDAMTCKIDDLPIEDGISLETWLEQHAQPKDILLAHALDGVIWGKIVDGKLRLQPSAMLNLDTLQELRLFNYQREIHVWRTGDIWHACSITEKPNITKDVDYIEESYILWGTRGKPLDNEFTQMHHRAEGLSHTVPIDTQQVNDQNSRLSLLVRHYFGEDANGVNYIAYSRLVCLDVKEFKNDKQEK